MNKNTSVIWIKDLITVSLPIGLFIFIIYVFFNYSLLNMGLIFLGLGIFIIIAALVYFKICGNGCFNGMLIIPGIVFVFISILFIIIGYF